MADWRLLMPHWKVSQSSSLEIWIIWLLICILFASVCHLELKYAIWPKVCGHISITVPPHVNLIHLIPKLWSLVCCWCQMLHFQLFPKVTGGADVTARCRGAVMLKHERDKRDLWLQSWRPTAVSQIAVWSISSRSHRDVSHITWCQALFPCDVMHLTIFQSWTTLQHTM